MPTYEYQCKDCENVWEIHQSITEEPIKKCPKCEKESATRLISGGLGFELKGTGWFRDGY